MTAGNKPHLVVFLGGLGGAPVERLVGEARRAASLDSIEAALASGSYAGAVLVTDEAMSAAAFPGLEVDLDGGQFHFGRRLAGVIRKHSLERIVYMGGGSVPLFEGADFACIGEAVAGGAAVTNNRYSSDLVGFEPPESRLLIESAERDNALARKLIEEGSVDVAELPRTPATLFDIDAPTDVAVLKLTGLGGPRLRKHVEALNVETDRYERVLPLFLNSDRQIIVAGRVGSHAWQYLESETACRVRLFAEERGMEADGRADSGAARSLLGHYLEAAGTERFFETLAGLGDAAFIDSRVMAAHVGARPSREDRFLSDLGRWQEISDPFLRDLTRGAAEAPLPVLLGGHSLMSGALMLLNEHAWQERDAGRL